MVAVGNQDKSISLWKYSSDSPESEYFEMGRARAYEDMEMSGFGIGEDEVKENKNIYF